MKNNMTITILAALMLLSSPNKAAVQKSPTGLQIYLPRSVSIKGSLPNLGQIAIIQGEESLIAKAEKIAMGRISIPGQKLVISRTTLLSRLACNGIPAWKVTLTGAEKITLTQKHNVIKSEYFAEKALKFLKDNLPDASICQWKPIRRPKELLLASGSENIKTSLSFVKINSKNQAKIRITLSSDGKKLASQDITFLLKFNTQRLVAKTDIPTGAIVTPENIKLEKVISNYPDPVDSAQLLYSRISTNEPKKLKTGGALVAKRSLRAGTVIRPGMIGTSKPQVILKRNQNVIIKFDKFGLLITATGKAMQDGRTGEYIKVKNVDSQRIIMARVLEDGTVEPVL
jgi:flagella basal body P-ring formation protein FlgA